MPFTTSSSVGRETKATTAGHVVQAQHEHEEVHQRDVGVGREQLVLHLQNVLAHHDACDVERILHLAEGHGSRFEYLRLEVDFHEHSKLAPENCELREAHFPHSFSVHHGEHS